MVLEKIFVVRVGMINLMFILFIIFIIIISTICITLLFLDLICILSI